MQESDVTWPKWCHQVKHVISQDQEFKFRWFLIFREPVFSLLTMISKKKMFPTLSLSPWMHTHLSHTHACMHTHTYTHTHTHFHTHTHRQTHTYTHTFTRTHTEQIHQDLLFFLCRLHPASGHTDSHYVRPSVQWKGSTGHGTGDAEQHRCLQGTSRAVSSHRYYNHWVQYFCSEFCFSSYMWDYNQTG